jgi:hypothetical protein
MKVIAIESARDMMAAWNERQANDPNGGDVVFIVERNMKERVDKFVKEQGQYFIKTIDAVVTILQENGRTSKYAQKIALAFLANEWPAKFIEWPAVHEDLLDLVDEMLAQTELLAVTVDGGSIDCVEDLQAACAFVNDGGPNRDSGYEIIYELSQELFDDVKRYSDALEFIFRDLESKSRDFSDPKNLNDRGKLLFLLSECGYSYKSEKFGLSSEEIEPDDMKPLDDAIKANKICFELKRVRR